MNYTNVFKRQSYIIVVSIIIIAVIIIGASYALFTTRDEGSAQTLTAGTLSATFNEGVVLGTNLVPMEDDEALTRTDNVYNFSLSNTGSLPISYELTIFNNLDGVNDENMLAHKYIKVSVDNGTSVYLDSLTKVDDTITSENSVRYVLKTGTIAEGVTNEAHTIRVWIAKVDSTGVDVDTSIIGKTIGLKVGLSGTVQE